MGMTFGGTKTKLLVAFLICLPQCIANAYTRKNIRAGFLGDGMIDELSLSVPDCLMCLETLRVPFFPDSASYVEKKIML